MPKTTKSTRPTSARADTTGFAEKPQRLSATVAAPRKVIVTIGIDFGTSSTKVFFRLPETKATPFVCLFDGNPNGYPPVGLPSTVRVVDGKVYFAAEAEGRLDGEVFRSFKTCLRCKLVNQHCIHCFDGRNPVPGHRTLPSGEASVPPDELAAWYLAHVIAQISKRVRARHGSDAQLMYNMAAPMDVIQRAEGRNYYERALFLAAKLADVGVAEQGIDLESLRFHYNRLSAETPTLPEEGDRTTFVVAETRAGMVAYSNSRAATSGLYALIDIGAGTTDMSIFRYMVGKHVPEAYAPQFYSTAVHAGGADRVDQLVLREVIKNHPEITGNLRSEWLGRIRTAKQDGQMSEIIPLELYKQVSAKVAGELRDAYKNVWFAAYEKEKRIKNWQDMTMFLIGGGSKLPHVQEVLGASPWQGVPRPQVLSLGLSDQIACDGNQSAANDVSRYENLLMVAFGLSFPYLELEKYKMPSEVMPLPMPEPVWERPYRSIEDFGKDGHWW